MVVTRLYRRRITRVMQTTFMMVPVTRRWLLPAVIFSVLVFGYILYNSTSSNGSESIQRLASSGAYSSFQVDQGQLNIDGAPLTSEITVVTSFFPADPHAANNPGAGDESDPYSRWMEWSKLFRNMSNPVIAYLGSVQYLFYFEAVRGGRAITRTNMTLLQLPELEIYKLKSQIESTVSSSVLNLQLTPDELLYAHSKYELLKHAAKINPFRTTHMIWLDIGPYNSAFPNVHTYHVDVPDQFDITRVSYRTAKSFESKNLKDVFEDQSKYYKGDFIFGGTETMAGWCETYLEAMRRYLDAGLVGTDETTLYAMMTDRDNNYRDMVQTFKPDDKQFAAWYEKMSGLTKPYGNEKSRQKRTKTTDDEG